MGAEAENGPCFLPPGGKPGRIGAIPAQVPHRASDDEPSLDRLEGPRAVARARARRRARIEHQQELRRARIRFFALLGALVFLALFISLSIWEKIQAVFGL
jgi:hypothetical protein